MELHDQVGAYVQAALHEYDSLRSESMDARAAQRSSLAWGTVGASAVGGLVAGAIEEDVPVLSVFLLLFVLPGLLTMTMILWMGELVRMRRAGEYLQTVEQRITHALRAVVRQLTSETGLPEEDASLAPLRWEQWLQGAGRTRHLTWLYIPIMSVARAVAVVSPLLAVPIAFAGSFPGNDSAWQYSVLVIAVAGCAFQLWASAILSSLSEQYLGTLWPEAAWFWVRGARSATEKEQAAN